MTEECPEAMIPVAVIEAAGVCAIAFQQRQPAIPPTGRPITPLLSTTYL